jgi:hypothetical protein
MAAMKPARILSLCVILIGTSVLAQKPTPIPTIEQPVLPKSVTPRDAVFTLFVNRTGFASGAVLNQEGPPVTATGYRKYRLVLILRARAQLRWPWGAL